MITDSLLEYLVGGVIFLALGFFLGWFFLNKKFLNFGAQSTNNDIDKLKWYHICLGFSGLIFLQKYFLQVVDFFAPSLTSNQHRTEWVFLVGIVCLAIFLISFLKRCNLSSLFYRHNKYLKAGFYTLVLSLPWVLLASTIGMFIVDYFNLPLTDPMDTRKPSSLGLG